MRNDQVRNSFVDLAGTVLAICILAVVSLAMECCSGGGSSHPRLPTTLPTTSPSSVHISCDSIPSLRDALAFADTHPNTVIDLKPGIYDVDDTLRVSGIGTTLHGNGSTLNGDFWFGKQIPGGGVRGMFLLDISGEIDTDHWEPFAGQRGGMWTNPRKTVAARLNAGPDSPFNEFAPCQFADAGAVPNDIFTEFAKFTRQSRQIHIDGLKLQNLTGMSGYAFYAHYTQGLVLENIQIMPGNPVWGWCGIVGSENATVRNVSGAGGLDFNSCTDCVQVNCQLISAGQEEACKRCRVIGGDYQFVQVNDDSCVDFVISGNSASGGKDGSIFCRGGTRGRIENNNCKGTIWIAGTASHMRIVNNVGPGKADFTTGGDGDNVFSNNSWQIEGTK